MPGLLDPYRLNPYAAALDDGLLGRVQLAGDVVPLRLNDPSDFDRPEQMPESRVQPWDKYDWARQLFILPANDPGRRSPKRGA
jgi:hypothetical protein